MKLGTHILFWSSMVIAIVVSGYLFKDLADISQWIIQSERATTMWVWYNRNVLAFVALLAISVPLVIKYRQRDVLGNKTLTVLVVLFAFQFYSGFINPHMMMRERQSDGVFVPIAEAQKYIDANESVIVLEVNGHARAHADAQLLRPHVVGNGTIGGENIVMTYCGLTNLGMAVTPEINGEPLDLRPITQLQNNLVLADRNSNEPIQQLWMKKESDVNAGVAHQMREWPTFRMPFAKFAEAYPDGEVYLNDYLVEDMKPGFFDNPFLAVYDPLMDMIFNHGISDQAINEEPTFPTVEYTDKRLASKEKVWAFNIGDDYVAYSEDFVRANDNVINTTVGGRDVVVAYDENFESLGIYYNTTGTRITNIDFFGNTNAGPLARVETLKAGAYWIIWSTFFPQTDVNRSYLS